ncbi:MAG TPA: hypothetical protein VOA41_14110 [Candidatus Dormibacteraeota bacterium]|nr:hypothetical protein [Candidatus Dormibacteraeota bacterium]
MIPLLCSLPTRTRLIGRHYKIRLIIASMLAALDGRARIGIVAMTNTVERLRASFMGLGFAE